MEIKKDITLELKKDISMEITIDEKQITDSIIGELKRHHLLGGSQNVTIIYNTESDDIVYTVSEVSKIIKCNTNYTYSLIKAGHLPALKLGSIKVRRTALLEFLEKNEGNDFTDSFNVKPLNLL